MRSPIFSRPGKTQAEPIVWMNGSRQWLSCARLHPWEHEGIGIRVRTLRPPQVNRVADGLGDRDKAVIGATIAVLAFDFLALQPTTPRAIDDREYTAAVASPSQAEEFTRPEGTEARDQEDGAVAYPVKTSQQLSVHLDRKNRLVGLLDLGNDSLASDISLQDLLVNGLRQSSFDEIAHMVNNRVRVFLGGQPVE